MCKSILRIVASYGGWKLFDDGRPIFWFLERDQAIETAKVLADARANLRFIPACVEAELETGGMELIIDYA